MAVLGPTAASARDTIRAALAALAGWSEASSTVDAFPRQTSYSNKAFSLGFGEVSISQRSRHIIPMTISATLVWSHQLRFEEIQADQTTALEAQSELIRALLATGLPLNISSATIGLTSNQQWQIGTIRFTASVLEAVLPIRSTLPAIPAVADVGTAISVTPGTYENPAYSLSYQWYLDGGLIAGADSDTYTPVPGDAGGALTVLEECTTTAGSSVVASNASLVSVATLAAVHGFTFPILLGDTLKRAGAIAFPASGTLVLLARLTNGGTNNAGLIRLEDSTGKPTLFTGVTAAGEIYTKWGDGSGGGYSSTTAAIPLSEVYSGELFPVRITWSPGAGTVLYGKAGVTATIVRPTDPLPAATMLLMNWGGDVTKNQAAGALDCALFDYVMSDAEWSSVVDGGIDAASAAPVLRPIPTGDTGTAVTVPADVGDVAVPGTWSIASGAVSSSVVAGGIK